MAGGRSTAHELPQSAPLMLGQPLLQLDQRLQAHPPANIILFIQQNIILFIQCDLAPLRPHCKN